MVTASETGELPATALRTSQHRWLARHRRFTVPRPSSSGPSASHKPAIQRSSAPGSVPAPNTHSASMPHRLDWHPRTQCFNRRWLRWCQHQLRPGYWVLDPEPSTQAVPLIPPAPARPNTAKLLCRAHRYNSLSSAVLPQYAAMLGPTKVQLRTARMLFLGRQHLLRIIPVLADNDFRAGPQFDLRAVNTETFVATRQPCSHPHAATLATKGCATSAESTRPWLLAKTLWETLP